MQVLVTGANGFVGRHVVARLVADGHTVTATSRHPIDERGDPAVTWVATGAVDGETDWTRALAGVDAIVHLVAVTHAAVARLPDTEAAYWSVNVAGTDRLVRQARAAGVRRFLFLSSVKVNGERASRPVREDDPAAPQDAYGRTKLAAEQIVQQRLEGTATDYVILRPPLVYGPGVQANMRRLATAALRGWPLPFAGVSNRRSFVSVINLADAIARAAGHPAAGNRLYLVSDGVDLSTAELIRRIARAGGRRPRLFNVPPGPLRLALRLAGGRGLETKLLASLPVDIRRLREDLAWMPPQPLEAGLADMVEEILAHEPLRARR